MDIFIIAEHRNDELTAISLELLNLANSIKGASRSNAIVLSQNTKTLAEQLARYSDKVWAIEGKTFADYNPEVYADVIQTLIKGNQPALMLIGDTSTGRELAPYLALKLDAPVQTDAVGVEIAGDRIRISKYLFQGKVMIDMELRKSSCYVLTLRQGVFKEGPQVNGSIEVINTKPSITPRREFVKYIEPEIGDVDISKEDVLVTVGRGIADPSKMEIVEELAELIGGVLAGSRPAVDYGWLPKDRQVGISGKVVSPKLYLGLGVSGASQHVMGMKDSELIVAINKDPAAPIFQVAEYGIVGDIFRIVPEIVNRLNQIKDAA